MNPTSHPTAFCARAAATAVVSLLFLGAAARAEPAAMVLAATAPTKTADAAAKLPSLTVAQIVAKHVAARGSADAWKAVRGVQLTGKLEAGRGSLDAVATKTAHAGKNFPVKEGTTSASLPAAAAEATPQALLPIVMDFERPNKSRIEVVFDGKTAIQVYDGSKGWKYRPFLNRNDIEPFTAEEARSEASRAEPEGVLVDYAAKGSTVSLDGTDKVDGQDAYRLKVTQKGGRVVHVWINAKSFLDVKIDGTPQRMDGKLHDVHVAQRDFRTVNGVVIPFVLETSVDGYPDTHKLLVEKAVVNPKFDAGTFAKPKV